MKSPLNAKTPPGLYQGVPFDDYATFDAVNVSKLKPFERSAAHAHYEITHPTETAAKSLGQATHVSVLEPARFVEEYAVAPQVDRRTKAGKATWEAFAAANQGRILLRAEEDEACRAYSKAAWSHPLARELLQAKGFTEVTMIWRDDATGLLCKGRCDRFCVWDGFSTIVDVKTTRDASPRGFARECAEYQYHWQAAWYLRGADVLSPVARRFVFIAIEKTPPYCVGVYELDTAFLDEGVRGVGAALTAYKNATESGVWPGYSTSIKTIYAPAWALQQKENEA